MVVELPAAMLACARVGAVHSVVFGGFSAESLAGRILDASSDVVQLKGITDKVRDGGMGMGMTCRSW